MLFCVQDIMNLCVDWNQICMDITLEDLIRFFVTFPNFQGHSGSK